MAGYINLGGAGGGTGGAVDSVNGQTGTVDLTAADVGAAAVADLTAETNRAEAAEALKYEKPAGGIPFSDLASVPVTSVNGHTPDGTGNADVTAADLGAYVMPSGGIPVADLGFTPVRGVNGKSPSVDTGVVSLAWADVKPVGGVPIADLTTAPVLTVNGTGPDGAGNVAVSGTGSVSITSSDSSINVGGTPSAPVLTVNPAKVVKKVNGVLPDSTGAVTISATVSGLKVANELVADGVTDDTAYLQGLNDEATGPTTIIIPSYATNIAVYKLNLSDHVRVVGGGRRSGKAAYGADTGGTTFCLPDNYSPANDGTLEYMIKVNNNTQLAHCTVYGYNDKGVGLHGPAVWVYGGGANFDTVGIDTGQGPGIFFDSTGTGYPTGADSIDSTVKDLLAVAHTFNTRYYVRTCTSTATSGNTFTIDDATDIAAGMVPINVMHSGFLSTGSIVTKVVGNTITVYGDGINNSMNNHTILFVKSPTMLVTCSDIMMTNVRSLTGTAIAAGADTQWGDCHFSGGTTNKVHNIIVISSQGQTFNGCNMDNAVSGTVAHMLRIYGPFIYDKRVQSGIPGGGAAMPMIQDCGGDRAHGFFINALEVELSKANGVALDAIVCYSKWLWDTTSSTFKAVNAGLNTANPLDRFGVISFSKSGFNRADASGNPILATLGTSTAPTAAAGLSSAVNGTFAGVYSLVIWDDGTTAYTMGPKTNVHP